jgi:hypothetical protein
MKTKLLTAICFLALLVSSCNKNFYSEPQHVDQSTGDFGSYLRQLLSYQTDPGHFENLSSLESWMLPKSAKIFEFNDSIKVQIIPLKGRPTYFKTPSDAGNWYVVYRFNDLLDIHKVEILNLKTGLDNQSDQTKIEAIFKLYRFDIPMDGAYTQYSLGGRYLQEEKYENLKLTGFSAVLPDLKSPNQIWPKPDPNRVQMNSLCIDWYIVTTVYFADGSSYSYSEYLNTTCNSVCSPTSTIPNESIACDPNSGSGGGGGGDIGQPYLLHADRSWVVAYNPSGAWTVMSYERFIGERGANYHKFISAQHINSASFSVGSNTPGVPYATWQELSASTVIIHDWMAQATVQGKVIFSDGHEISIYGIKNFPFNGTF